MRKGGFLTLLIAGSLLCAQAAFADFSNGTDEPGQSATCPAGTRPATSADLASMRAAGIPNPTIGECWEVSSPIVGQEEATAKQDLLNRMNQPGGCSTSGGVTTKNQAISGLNAGFAQKLDTMLKAMPSSLGYVHINSAYRTVQCENGAKRSAHMTGCAVDLASNKSVCDGICRWIKQNGSTYGIQLQANPTTCMLGSFANECNHITPTNLDGSNQCGAGGTISPVSRPSITDTLRSATIDLGRTFGITKTCDDGSSPYNGQCPLSRCTDGSVIMGESCYPPSVLSQCPTSYSLYNYTQNQCGTQQQCPQGFVPYGGACYPMNTSQQSASPQQLPPQPQPQPQTQPISTQNPISSQLQNGNTNTNTNSNPSAIDLINQYANQGSTSTKSGSSSTPLILNSSTLDIVQLISQAPPIQIPDLLPTATSSRATSSPLNTIVSTQPQNSRSTFTSSDLSGTENLQSGFSLEQNSRAFAVLETIKNDLLGIISYLKKLGTGQ
jgi:hypothetical protein